ncbi:hypothetical protein HDU97_008955 [Phlyctochytrium planicorne]|nr:hypothetical protein HDU97_008955 [Phlyctochytrium planicorne]
MATAITSPPPTTSSPSPSAIASSLSTSNPQLGLGSASSLSSQISTFQPPTVPIIIVHPPHEDGEEPSISFAPNETLSGLPNEKKTRVQSALNSTLQVFMALPEMTEELPFSSSSEYVQRFVSTVRYVHCEASKVADSNLVDLDWWRDLAGLPVSDEPADDAIESIKDYEKISRSLLDGVLGPCRIGRKFVSDRKVEAPAPIPKPKSKKNDLFFSASSLADDSEPETKDSPPKDSGEFRASDLLDEGPAAAAEKDKGSTGSLNIGESPHMLTLPIGDYGENETVGVIALLNKTLGLAPQPTFFFGYGNSNSGGGGGGSGLARNSIFASELSKPSSSSAAPGRSTSPTKPTQPATPTVRFTKLPDLLVLSFKRPLTKSSPPLYHRTAVEMPMDLDLGFALDTSASRRGSGGSSRKEKNTFYKLHGFVTQTEGRFLAYTRSLAGVKWYKCEDDVVAEADLGARVASKGVLLAVYRLQEKKH